MAAESPVGLLLRNLAGVLEKRGHRWYLCGAQAVAVWGRPRTSADVDVTAEVDLGEVVDLVRDIEAAGFSVRVADPADFASRTRVIPFLHVATQIPLDLVLAGPGLEEEFLARSVEFLESGVVIRVISPEDLLVTKILAGRSKDLEDVNGILREQGEHLDLERVRRLLSTLDSALSRSDLLSTLEALLAREAGS